MKRIVLLFSLISVFAQPLLAVEAATEINFLFVIDKSGSNNTTDAMAEKRHSNVLKFYETNRIQPFYQWGLLAYSNNEVDSLIKPIFTNDEAAVLSGIDLLKSRDFGGTPYVSALIETREVILENMKKVENEGSTYMVFFISDGDPTDVRDIGSLRNLVYDITSLNPGRVFLSTAYYGPRNASAIKRLQEMAEEGGGKFVDFNDSPKWNFQDLLPF